MNYFANCLNIHLHMLEIEMIRKRNEIMRAFTSAAN